MFKWNEHNERSLLQLRDEEKLTYREIAERLGTTISSVKHKYVRLNQVSNEDRHHHPKEKSEQIRRVLTGDELNILETNAGRGNLTAVYREYGTVTAQEIDGKKVKEINDRGWKEVTAIKCDSFREIHRHICERKVFDVIDLDPYGFPSRFFPHVFELIIDGVLFVTFPKLGVQQINKITQEHYRVFWGISLSDKRRYEDKIHSKIRDFGLMHYRDVDLIERVDLGRMFRYAYRVRRESALKLVGLEVKRGGS